MNLAHTDARLAWGDRRSKNSRMNGAAVNYESTLVTAGVTNVGSEDGSNQE